MNKRGAETTIGTIVILILAILVLVVVAAGFAMGWNNLWSRFNLFVPKALSIDATVAQCEGLCLATQKYAYCCNYQKVNGIADGKEKYNCDELNKGQERNDQGEYTTDIGANLPITCEIIDCKEVKC